MADSLADPTGDEIGAAGTPATPWCRVYRAAKNLRFVADLEHLAGIQHAHPVADLADHAQVVRDVDHAELALPAQAIEQVENLRFDRDVERGGRLIEDEQLGIADKRRRDQHALLHAARQLMRIGRTRLPGSGSPTSASAVVALCDGIAG